MQYVYRHEMLLKPTRWAYSYSTRIMDKLLTAKWKTAFCIFPWNRSFPETYLQCLENRMIRLWFIYLFLSHTSNEKKNKNKGVGFIKFYSFTCWRADSCMRCRVLAKLSSLTGKMDKHLLLSYLCGLLLISICQAAKCTFCPSSLSSRASPELCCGG